MKIVIENMNHCQKRLLSEALELLAEHIHADPVLYSDKEFEEFYKLRKTFQDEFDKNIEG